MHVEVLWPDVRQVVLVQLEHAREYGSIVPLRDLKAEDGSILVAKHRGGHRRPTLELTHARRPVKPAGRSASAWSEGWGHRPAALLACVLAIKCGIPLALAIRGLPVLANAAVRVGRPGDSVLCDLTIGSDSLTLKHHARAAKATLQQQQSTRGVDPCLMPHPARGVIHVEAFTAVAPIAGIPLMQDAASIFASNAIDTCQLSVRCVDVPIPQPEVELTVFHGLAGTHGSRHRCGKGQQNGECGADQAEPTSGHDV